MEKLAGWRKFPLMFVGCLLLATTTYAHQNAQAFEKGLHWLIEQQQPSGAMHGLNDTALSWQASAEAAAAATLTDADEEWDRSALAAWFSLQTNSSAEYAARALSTTTRLQGDPQQYMQAVLERQNPDGGFGDEPGFASSVYDTSLALQALALTGMRATPETGEAISFLLGKQQPDGGFGIDAQNLSSHYVTALAVRALAAYRYVYEINDALQRAHDYLYDQVESGSDWSSDWEAAQFLLAVVPGTVDPGRYSPSLTWLKLQQLENGSWQSDVFATALALQALHLGDNIRLPDDPVASIRGRLIDSESSQPLAGASITVSYADDYGSVADEHGEFTIYGMTPGEYQLGYQAPGYFTASQSIRLVAGQLADLGNIGLVLVPTSARISGVISDAINGSVIAGGRVRASQGEDVVVTVTDVSGRYTLLTAAGQTLLQVDAEGYQSITAEAELRAGAAVGFSPGLYPMADPVPPEDDVTPPEEDAPPPLEVAGRVIDGDSGAALAGALIRNDAADVEILTDGEGRFLWAGLTPGEHTFTVSLVGYDDIGLGVVLPENGLINVGVIHLTQNEQPEYSTISGRVIDADSGLGIAGARVAIEGVSVLADASGHYRFEDIALLDFVIGANASGYMFGSTPVSLARPRNLTVDISLLPTDVNGIVLDRVMTDQPAYQAYDSVEISATFSNRTVRERRVLLYVLVRDRWGKVIDQFPATDMPPPPNDDNAEAWAHYQQHLNDAIEVLAPSETRTIALQRAWNAGRQVPGAYEVAVQALDAADSQLMAEGGRIFDVLPTQRLPSATLIPSPSFALMDSTVTLGLSVVLRNASNVPVQVMLDWRLRTPDGEIIEQGVLPISISREESTRTIDVATIEHTFTASGHYAVEMDVVGDVVPDMVAGVDLFVPPTVRLTVEQDLSPQQHIPGDGRHTRIRIQVKGVDGE